MQSYTFETHGICPSTSASDQGDSEARRAAQGAIGAAGPNGMERSALITIGGQRVTEDMVGLAVSNDEQTHTKIVVHARQHEG